MHDTSSTLKLTAEVMLFWNAPRFTVTGDRITDENRDEELQEYDERGDIIAADDVRLHHSALRLLAQKVSVHLLTASN